jgi:hypothetical protein
MNSGQHKFVEELLKQMPELNSEPYTRYRRELDDKLARARRDEKAMRWIVLGAWAIAFMLWAAAMALSFHSARNSQGQLPDALLLAMAAVMLLLPAAALLLLALYLFKYRRRVTAARASAQAAALAEVQRQLNELRAQLLPAQKDKGGSPTK